MNRFKLLLVALAVLVSTVAVRPAKSDDTCIFFGLCRDCPATNPLTPPEKQPCRVNPCTGESVCGTCSTHCVPPPA